MIRLAILEETARTLRNELLRDDSVEHGAFCLLRQAKGHEGVRLLVTEVLSPPPDAWEYQETDMLRPSARWISAAVSQAINARAGLLFVHSHPRPNHPLGLSLTDLKSFRSLAETIAPILDGPFAAAVVHPEGWAGVVWLDCEIVPIDRIVSVSRTLTFLSPTTEAGHSALDDRQRDALGVVHDRVRTLTVGVVGAGGLGAPVAEQLVRMGVFEVITVDHDLIDTDSNVRRVFGARISDLRDKLPKVDVLFRHLTEIGLDVRIRSINSDVRREAAFRHLLDADVVISATDTHGSRAVINELASTYLLPVVDVGVRVSAKLENRLAGLVAEMRVLTPTTPCLWCRKTINADTIRTENLPVQEREKLQREGYVVGGVDSPTPSVAALTVLGSGLATSALLALLSEEGDVVPSCYWVDGFLGDSGVSALDHPQSDCRCRQQVGLGDSAAPSFMP
jgi:molybdopterin-synthase adenylyltransferase